jgi:glycosyltransferase involved in cell wall biosynthesis
VVHNATEVAVPSDIAVIMAAHNAERTIRHAVESILDGTLACDVFIVDDASRIPVTDVLAPLADRITIIRLDVNRGPAAARNGALARVLAAKYKYAAIMDADDIAHPTRLAEQKNFLDANPQVGAVGTWVRQFDDRTGETVLSLNRATSPEAIRKLMFFNIGMSHATAMLRVEALSRVGLYDESFAAAEDYELLRRIATRYDLANIPECLVSYRISPQGQSKSRRRRQLYDRLRTQLKYFEPLEWRAFAGVLKTLLLMLVPPTMSGEFKLKLRGVGTPGAAFPASGRKN